MTTFSFQTHELNATQTTDLVSGNISQRHTLADLGMPRWATPPPLQTAKFASVSIFWSHKTTLYTAVGTTHVFWGQNITEMSLQLIPPGTPLKELKAIPRFPIRIWGGEGKGRWDGKGKEWIEWKEFNPANTYDRFLDTTAGHRVNIQKNWVPASDKSLWKRSKRQTFLVLFWLCYLMNLFSNTEFQPN